MSVKNTNDKHPSLKRSDVWVDRQIGCLRAVTVVCCIHFLIAIGIALYHHGPGSILGLLYLFSPLLIPRGAAWYPLPKPVSFLLDCLAYLLTFLCLYFALFSRRRSTFRLSIAVLFLVLLFCLHGCYRYGDVFFSHTGL